MSVFVRVWDLPTRLFHWLLATAVVALVVTAQMGLMTWHFRLGYAVLTLLVFRLVWGLVGGRWSRFTSFFYSPRILLRYLRGRGDASWTVGHTPTGALAVFAMLFFLLAQVATGLVSDDEISSAGPFAALVSSAVVGNATWYHAKVGKIVLIILAVLHLLAIAYYRFVKGSNLVRPMLTGDKIVESETPPSRDDGWSRFGAALLLGAAAGAVVLLLSLAPAG